MAANRDGLSSLCRIASQALQEISNLEPPNSSSNNQGENQPETSSSAVQSGNSSSIIDELSRSFPTLNSNTVQIRNQCLNRSSGKCRGKRGKRRSTVAYDRDKSSKVGRARKQIVNRDLVVIPDPKTTDVPSHGNRVRLENLGLVIHEFPFDRSWDASKLREEIKRQLPDEATDFEFVKACYGTLIKPKLANSVEINGDIVMKLAGQGSVYIRTLKDVACKQEETSDEDDSNDDLLLTGVFSSNPQPATEPSVPSTSSAYQSLLHSMHSTRSVNNMLAIETVENDAAANQPVELTTSMAVENKIVSAGHYEELPEVTVPENLRVTEQQANGSPCAIIEDQLTGASASNEHPLKFILVHRTRIKQDMLEIFSDSSIMSSSLSASIIDGLGNIEVGAGSGVLREVFSLFWKDVNDSLLIGEQERVPYIRHDYDKLKWVAVARILVKGFTEISYFPISLSKVFLSACLFGEQVISEDMLLQSFKAYISNDEAKIVEKIILGEVGPEDEDVIELLNSFDCKRKPCDDNLKTIILEIAQKELVQKPQYVCNCWIPILAALLPYFPEVNALYSYYKSVIPTNSKVVHILNANPTTSAETDVFGYLKRYIRGLDPSKLASFLRFVTGSDIMITDTLNVSFINVEGLGRRPVAHTCGFTLELPCTYANLCELREEFNNILAADSWEMDIV